MDLADRAHLDQLIASLEEVIAATGDLVQCESACRALRELADRLRGRIDFGHRCPHPDGNCCIDHLESTLALA